jgi:hypothetical protein
MPRFQNRTKRLERRRESETMGALMPVAWLIGGAGALGMAILGVDYLVHQRWDETFFGIAAAVAATPLLVLLIRLLRGHFNPRLREE